MRWTMSSTSLLSLYRSSLTHHHTISSTQAMVLPSSMDETPMRWSMKMPWTWCAHRSEFNWSFAGRFSLIRLLSGWLRNSCHQDIVLGILSLTLSSRWSDKGYIPLCIVRPRDAARVPRRSCRCHCRGNLVFRGQLNMVRPTQAPVKFTAGPTTNHRANSALYNTKTPNNYRRF